MPTTYTPYNSNAVVNTSFGGSALDPSMSLPQVNPNQPNVITGSQSGYGADTASIPTPQVPSSINSTNTAPSTPIDLPQYPTTTIAPGANTSVPNPQPAPTAADLITQGTQATPAEQQQKAILNQIAQLTGQSQTQNQLINQYENAAGIPALNKTYNDLNTQLEGLNNQSTALSNEAQYTIPNAAQVSAEGRGITAGGLAPITASQLRMNQIKQGAIASQSLTLKSALYGAQGNLMLAKDAADKAATAQFEGQEQQIKYQQAQLAAIAPTLDKEQKVQAAILQSKLDARTAQIADAKDNMKTGIALATAALKNFPNDPTAQHNAQLALQEANSGNPDLAKIFGLVGQYQTDPNAVSKTLSEIAQNKAQTDYLYANARKSRADAVKQELENGTNTPGSENIPPENKAIIDSFNFALTGTPANQQSQIKSTFNQLLKSGDTEAAKAYVVRVAISNLPAAEQTQTIGRSQALSSLQDIQSLLTQAKGLGLNTNIFTGTVTQVAQKLGTTNNADASYIASRIQQQLQTYRRSMTGVAFSPQESAEYAKIFPDITNTETLNTAKIQALVDAFDSNNRAQLSTLIGDKNYTSLFGAKPASVLPSQQQTATTPELNTLRTKYNY